MDTLLRDMGRWTWEVDRGGGQGRWAGEVDRVIPMRELVAGLRAGSSFVCLERTPTLAVVIILLAYHGNHW